MKTKEENIGRVETVETSGVLIWDLYWQQQARR